MKTTPQTKRLHVRRDRKRLHVRRVLRTNRLTPRLSVFRSCKNIYGQVIDDHQGRTLAAASSLDTELRGSLSGKKKTEVAVEVGRLLAKRARAAGIEAVRFDRGACKYHGRIKALAEAAREGGLKF